MFRGKKLKWKRDTEKYSHLYCANLTIAIQPGICQYYVFQQLLKPNYITTSKHHLNITKRFTPQLHGQLLIIILMSRARHYKVLIGIDSSDRPSNRSQINWIQIVHFSARATLKFDGWPWKIIGHLFYGMLSISHHSKAIGEFKLKLQSGNSQFRSKSAVFSHVT